MKAKCLLLIFFLLTGATFAAERGRLVRVGNLYLSPDANSAKLADVERGREVVILETSRDWLHVEANLSDERAVTGWMLDKGVIRASTPNADKILYAGAVDSEVQATHRPGGGGPAQDAMRPYYPLAEPFP